jgi:outer membrane lipoprotein LolB
VPACISDDLIWGARDDIPCPSASVQLTPSALPLHRFGLILTAVFVAACASLPLEREAPAGRDAFELAGRVAVRYGNAGASGRIVWRHSQTTDELLITSPIGQGIASITRRDDEVRLVTAEQKEYEAQDVESLTEKVLGWRLPLAGLQNWVQGRTDPQRRAEVERDARSRITELRQDDWRVQYQEYEGMRPSKLLITHPGVEIRLVVDQWMGPQ